ncbi:hypothetical protein BACI349Y_550027 [Bacillus sp. 349Y]|nr:hypothetical protein BACI349Y_550027 [Bacillus sp. 349Y]
MLHLLCLCQKGWMDACVQNILCLLGKSISIFSVEVTILKLFKCFLLAIAIISLLVFGVYGLLTDIVFN